MRLGNHIQEADWKKEKHVPVITCPDKFLKGEPAEVELEVGKDIPHPNTTEHHIRWVRLYFKPSGDKFIYDLGEFSFAAHGESVAGPNQGPAYAWPFAKTKVTLTAPGTLHAVSYCNIHGLWESSREVAVD